MSFDHILADTLDFLAQYPPFDTLSPAELSLLGKSARLAYYEKNEEIVRQGDAPAPHFFVVKKGKVDVLQSEEGRTLLVDVCGKGDMFGLRAVLAQSPYIATCKAAEDSLVYWITMSSFEQVVAQNPKVALFLAAGFASGVVIFKPEEALSSTLEVQKSQTTKSIIQAQFAHSDFLEVFTERKLITCAPDCKIQEVAQMMSTHNIGSMLITSPEGLPLGIVTDSDLRKKVVAKTENLKQNPISSIMSAPVKTIAPKKTISEMMLLMTKFKITHLCITQDGSTQSAAVGIVSQRDLLLAQGNQPAILVKEMSRAQNVAQLKSLRLRTQSLVHSYLNQQVGIAYIADIITEINDLLTQKAIDFAIETLHQAGKPLPNCQFIWLALGSQGRKEQLLPTDQDNALIFHDPQNNLDPETLKGYFLEMATLVNETLAEVGFEKCPADMMASNPKWCLSLEEWQKIFAYWIATPDNQAVLNSNIFFDFRPLGGYQNPANPELSETLRQTIFAQIERYPIFKSFWAKSALQNPPPLSFFRGFVVEKTGDQKDQFDIKARAMMPLTDAARVLAYEYKLQEAYSTAERFRAVGQIAEEKEPHLANICKAAAMAYEILMQQRAQEGIKHQTTGRFINPQELNKLERQTLRNIFKTIEKLQEVFEVRYQLNYFK
jgi:CBS domain-containing protein